jgi:hypothetical protein
VVEVKYGSMWGGWCTVPHIGVPEASLWKNIQLGWEIFFSHTRLVLGDGSWIRFWYDRWCGDTKLKEDFPVFYSIACEKDAAVAASVEFSGGASQWNVIFTGKFMIGRWVSLLLFFRNSSLSLFKGGVKINYGGFLPKKEL